MLKILEKFNYQNQIKNQQKPNYIDNFKNLFINLYLVNDDEYIFIIKKIKKQ